MFKKLLILFYKDVLIIIKDKSGLGYLFVMPLALVFIMTSLQDNAYKALHNTGIKLVILNNDQDSLGNTIVREIRKTGFFEVQEISKSDNVDKSPEELVSKGKFKIGIIIPDSTTLYTKRTIKRAISRAFVDKKNIDDYTSLVSEIEIHFDPVIRTSYQMMIKSMLREFSSDFRTSVLLKEMNKRIPFKKSDISLVEVINFKEKYASAGKLNIAPNSVQHNIPAWILFAMFFIVLSLAGNMVKEREDGSFSRLRFMPVSYTIYFSKSNCLFIGLFNTVCVNAIGGGLCYAICRFSFSANR